MVTKKIKTSEHLPDAGVMRDNDLERYNKI